jgi:hypothetical protein
MMQTQLFASPAVDGGPPYRLASFRQLTAFGKRAELLPREQGR